MYRDVREGEVSLADYLRPFKEGDMKKADIVVSIMMFGVGIAAILKASDFPEQSRLMPYIYSSLLILVAILLGLRAFFGRNAAPEDPAWKDEPIPRVFLVMALVLGYIVSIQILGFYTSTALFMLVFLGVMHAASLFVSLGVSVGTSVAVYYFFEILLHIPIPRGLLF